MPNIEDLGKTLLQFVSERYIYLQNTSLMLKFVVFEISLNGFFMNRNTPSKLTFQKFLNFAGMPADVFSTLPNIHIYISSSIIIRRNLTKSQHKVKYVSKKDIIVLGL